VAARYSAATFSPITGEPRVAYNGVDGLTLRFAERVGTEWPIEIVDSTDDAGTAGVFVTMANDPVTGDAAIFHRGTHVLEGGLARFCERDTSGSWVCEGLADFSSASGMNGAIRFSADGQPFVAHSSWGSIFLTWWDAPSATWVSEFASVFGANTPVTLILDPDDGRHMISVVQRDGGIYSLNLLVRDGGN
jgi:hypothetical protein